MAVAKKCFRAVMDVVLLAFHRETCAMTPIKGFVGNGGSFPLFLIDFDFFLNKNCSM